MRNKLKYRAAFVLLLTVMGLACVPSYNTGTQRLTNHVNIYDPSTSNLQPDVFFYHSSEKETLLFFKVNASRMMSGVSADGSPLDDVVLDVKYAIRNAESREIVDTATFSYTFSKQKTPVFITYIPLDLEPENNYYASVLFIDKVKNSWKRVLANINKSDKQAAEYFFAEVPEEDMKPVLTNYISQGDSVRISSDMFSDEPLYVLSFGSDSLVPATGFSSAKRLRFSGEPVIDTLLYSTDTVIFPEKGFFKIVTDTLSRNGRDFFVGDAYYPYVKTPEAMLAPLKYIITDSKYRTIAKSESLKYAIDDFWIETGESIVAARELIRVYYNRVQTANQYFTSTKEGWQTDRGMVYILFGVPKSIYKTELQEEWVYAENDVNTSLIFRFERDTVSLSSNDYVLIRNERYHQAWNQAVITWRSGQAYSIR